MNAKLLSKGFAIAIVGASVRGDAFVKAGAAPTDAQVWTIEPPSYVVWHYSWLKQRVDPERVQVFRTKHEAWRWRRLRSVFKRATCPVMPAMAELIVVVPCYYLPAATKPAAMSEVA